MSLTANKGEWSEIYTLFKLLSEKRLPIGDENPDQIAKVFLPIIEILREEKEKKYKYNSIKDSQNVCIYNGSNELLCRIPFSTFKSQAEFLLNELKSPKNKSAFPIPETEDFMGKIHCSTIKASSKDKTDIKIIVHDVFTGLTPLLGFSIKSELGSRPTLLNPSSATNFIFLVKGCTFSEEEIATINAINGTRKIKDRLDKIGEKGGSLEFLRLESPIFEQNLLMVDGWLPPILAYALLEHYTKGNSSLSDISSRMDKENSLNFPCNSSKNFYSHKIKRLLSDIALGLKPKTEWDGKFEATGGYLVVREDGEVLCYHIFYKNQFEAYLLNSTQLDTPSSSRYKYGQIEKLLTGELIFKLNLQIRFK
ncbi:MAG: HpaII family restriction endonuclease [Opitutales bacterium]|nr:HpaII family restriction endonuclease [Opitutales bacterium]